MTLAAGQDGSAAAPTVVSTVTELELLADGLDATIGTLRCAGERFGAVLSEPSTGPIATGSDKVELVESSNHLPRLVRVYRRLDDLHRQLATITTDIERALG